MACHGPRANRSGSQSTGSVVGASCVPEVLPHHDGQPSSSSGPTDLQLLVDVLEELVGVLVDLLQLLDGERRANAGDDILTLISNGKVAPQF